MCLVPTLQTSLNPKRRQACHEPGYCSLDLPTEVRLLGTLPSLALYGLLNRDLHSHSVLSEPLPP